MFERYAVKTSEKANMHNRPGHAQFAEGLHFRKVQRKKGDYERGVFRHAQMSIGLVETLVHNF